MWTCPHCRRIFEKVNQPHSCHSIPLEEHFKNKEKAQKLFSHLVKQIDKNVGKCKIVSIPCCIHVFGKYDFLAALPKKDNLEIRFALGRKLESPRINQSVPLSAKTVKNCMVVRSEQDVDNELIKWLKESYQLKDQFQVSIVST